MKVIDGHAYLGKTVYVDQSPMRLISDMDRLGVDISVVVAPPPGPYYRDANSLVSSASQSHPGRLAALYRANPRHKGEEERVDEALHGGGFVGVQLDPTNDGYGINGQAARQVVGVAERHEAPVYVHSGDSIFCPPEYVADLASSFEGVNFVTDKSARAPRAAQARCNLFLMTYSFPTTAFQRGHTEGFDLDRLVFASESPVGNLDVEMKAVELAGLDKTTKEKLLGENLLRILKL
jgi:predicted TIM-barrel fold metal-dependent hydrolase